MQDSMTVICSFFYFSINVCYEAQVLLSQQDCSNGRQQICFYRKFTAVILKTHHYLIHGNNTFHKTKTLMFRYSMNASKFNYFTTSEGNNIQVKFVCLKQKSFPHCNERL